MKIFKRILLINFFMFATIFLVTSSSIAGEYKISNYVPQTEKIPISWTITGKVKDSISFGRFRYLNAKGEERETYENYLIVWQYNHQGNECHHFIVDTIDGHSPEIILDDLNKDGENEIIIFYHAGAHTHYWRIYKLGKNPQNPNFLLVRIAEIGSDWGRIKKTGQRKNGYYQIEAWDRDYSDFNKCDISTYSWVDGEYKKTSCKNVDLRTWGK